MCLLVCQLWRYIARLEDSLDRVRHMVVLDDCFRRHQSVRSMSLIRHWLCQPFGYSNAVTTADTDDSFAMALHMLRNLVSIHV